MTPPRLARSVPTEAEGLVVPVPDDPTPAEAVRRVYGAGLGLIPYEWLATPPGKPPPAPAGMTVQEWAFVRALCADRLDGDTAVVFADWLEDHGRDAAGRRVRLLRPAPGDVLVVSVENMSSRDYTALLAQADRLREETGLRVMVVAERDHHVRLLPAGQMLAAGWVRVEEAERMAAEYLRAGREEEAARSAVRARGGPVP